jgi:hypothetical protein
MLGSLLLLAAGLFMLTNLTSETDRAVLSLWMLVTGLGVGPSVPVFTLVVQNSVAAARIGVATGSLTFFQQIGGTIGLTLASTVLAERLVTEIPIQLVAAGVRKPIVDRFAVGAGVDITGTGDLGQRILTSLPPETKALIEPLILNIVQGIHEAFSLAVASTFWVGIVGALVAFVFVLFLQEQPMRSTVEIGEPAVEESTAVPNGAIG